MAALSPGIREHFVKPFPIMLFAVVMGMAGLVIAFEKATFLFGMPRLIHLMLLGLTSLLFAFIFTSYLGKVASFPEEAQTEAHHPV